MRIVGKKVLIIRGNFYGLVGARTIDYIIGKTLTAFFSADALHALRCAFHKDVASLGAKVSDDDTGPSKLRYKLE